MDTSKKQKTNTHCCRVQLENTRLTHKTQNIYGIYTAEADHTIGTFKNSQWRQHLQAVNISSFHQTSQSCHCFPYFTFCFSWLIFSETSHLFTSSTLRSIFKRPSEGALVASSGQKEHCVASVSLQLWHSTKITKSRCAGPHVDLLQKHREGQQMERLFMQVQRTI